MSILEEAQFKPNLTEEQKRSIEHFLKPLLPDIENLKIQSAILRKQTEGLVRQDQIAIINDVVNYNEELFQKNQRELHDIINRENDLAKQIKAEEANMIDTDKGKGESTHKKISDKFAVLQLQYIARIEKLDFPKIGEIKKVEKSCAPSFNKIWIWVLEIFYGVPSSKYFWEDFAKKAFLDKTDQGQELKRRMIVFPVANLSIFQIKELEQIINSDIPLLTDKLPKNEQLLSFYEILKELFKLNKIEYRMRNEGVKKVHADIKMMKEDKKAALMTSQKLNTTKFEIASEVQQIYALIDSEFK